MANLSYDWSELWDEKPQSSARLHESINYAGRRRRSINESRRRIREGAEGGLTLTPIDLSPYADAPITEAKKATKKPAKNSCAGGRCFEAKKKAPAEDEVEDIEIDDIPETDDGCEGADCNAIKGRLEEISAEITELLAQLDGGVDIGIDDEPVDDIEIEDEPIDDIEDPEIIDIDDDEAIEDEEKEKVEEAFRKLRAKKLAERLNRKSDKNLEEGIFTKHTDEWKAAKADIKSAKDDIKMWRSEAKKADTVGDRQDANRWLTAAYKALEKAEQDLKRIERAESNPSYYADRKKSTFKDDGRRVDKDKAIWRV